MNSDFQLVDPENAAAFLCAFPDTYRRRGEDYIRRGLVGEFEIHDPGVYYEVGVRGTTPYEVELIHDDDDGWGGECDCPHDFEYCKHIYAAMKTLLGMAGKGSAGRREAAPAAAEECLRERFAKANRKLPVDEEDRFLGAVTELYLDLWERNAFPTGLELNKLGIRPIEDRWNEIELWPEFPGDDHEFWLYVVNYARENQLVIPEIMEPVSDTTLIDERLAPWRKQREIDRWRRYFQDAPVGEYASEMAVEARSENELRLRLGVDEAELEMRRPDAPEFKRLSQSFFHTMSGGIDEGTILLTAASELLFGRIELSAYDGKRPRLAYADLDAMGVLYGILRTPALRELVVNEDGSPLQWSSDPVSWRLAEPSAESGDDYRLALTQADGERVSGLSFALNGSPSYYFVNGRVHPGPPFDTHSLKPGKEAVLPREAVEDRDGVTFLHRIGARLPESLSRRVREVSLRPRLVCRLTPDRNERCEIQVRALDGEGEVVEQWEKGRWIPVRKTSMKATAGKGEPDIEVIVRRELACIPSIFVPLNPTYDWRSSYTLPVNRNFPERFCEWLEALPAEVDVQLEGDLASLSRATVSGSVRLDVEESEIDWFDLSVVLNVDDTELTKEEIDLLLNAKGKWVRLDQKGWRRLAFELSEEDDEQLARLGLNPRELSAEPQRMHALQLAGPAAQRFLPEKQSEQVRRRVEEIQARVSPDVPASITAELRPYQTDGFHFLAYLSTNHFGGILADDMGLGKTVQTLVWLVWLREQGETGPILVVCPKSVMDNWRAETKRFAPTLSAKVWARGELAQLPERIGEADLHVINYNQLRQLGAKLEPISFTAVVLDEGQYVKNPSSQTAKVARALHSAHRLALTGTPIENRLLDLWSLMAFAMPGVLGNRRQFGKLYDAKDDPFARLRLSSRVRPFLIRRTKAQVAQDLPERIEEDLYCEIEGEQKKLYDAERKRAQQLLLGVKTQQQLNDLRFNFLISLLRLRQICCHPLLVKENSKARSAKVDALLEQLEPIMAEGSKVLIFSQFVQALKLVEKVIKKEGWPLWKLTGATENRGPLVEEFQNHEGAGVFLISLKAGGSGLNLTAASYVVLFDPWWNPAVENQAIDRTHRIGQTNRVIAYRLLIKDSIEEKIRGLQKRKQTLAEDVLGEEKFAQSLSIEDFQYLLSD